MTRTSARLAFSSSCAAMLALASAATAQDPRQTGGSTVMMSSPMMQTSAAAEAPNSVTADSAAYPRCGKGVTDHCTQAAKVMKKTKRAR